MQLKIATHYTVIFCFVSCIMAKSVYPGGCYECEEEVWEEVPCDEIPSNSTTIIPPSECYYTHIPKPTGTYPTTTTILTTTMTTPEMTTPTTMPPTTTMPITTTSSPVETTTAKNPYKKCYCECKVGCKEFCRKVVVNQDPKIKIVQVSKITEPVVPGPVQYTHYHQRQLVQKPKYEKSYSDSVSKEITEITDNNNYSNKYPPTTQAPPATSYKETIITEPPIYVSANKKHSYKNYPPKPKIPFYPKPLPTPAPSLPVYETSYARTEIGANNLYSPQTKPQLPPKHYREPTSYDFPIPFGNVFTKVTKSLHGPADNTEFAYTDLSRTYSNTNGHSSGCAQAAYSPPTSDLTQTYSNTNGHSSSYAQAAAYSPPTSDLSQTYSNTNGHSSSYAQASYSPPTSLKVSQLNPNVYLSNAPHYQDHFNALISDLLHINHI